jgi:type I restriction enzyme, S subunit
MPWAAKPLGDVLTFQRGFDITKADQSPGPYWVISSSGPNSRHNQFKVKGPGVVIGRKGTLGTAFYSQADYWPHDTTLWVKDFHGNDPRFAYYFVQTMGFEKFDVGASNPTLNRNHIHVLPVRWPDTLATQRCIASILSAYDDLIEKDTRRIAILEEMARRIYEEWFVRFRFPGHEGTRMVESELGLVPEGWAPATLADCATVTMGQSPSSEFYNDRGEGLPFHQGVTNFGPHFPTHKIFCSSDGRLAEEGDILVSVRAPVGRINLSPSRLVIGRGLCAVRSREDQQVFLLHRLFETFKEEDSMGNGAIFKAVSKQEVLALPFLVPPASLVKEFEQVAGSIWSLIRNLTSKCGNLRTTRDLLLPKLISGELDVSAMAGPEALAA